MTHPFASHPPLARTKDTMFVLSKNRPQTLLMTLASLKHIDAQRVIVDDSPSLKVQSNVKKITVENGGDYHGQSEQLRLMDKLGFPLSSEFFRPLGNSQWDTGYVRNYVLLLAASLRCDKAMFVDDDIIMREPGLYSRLNRSLSKYDFVGSRATGLIDDSVLGHLQRAMGDTVGEYVSAGFLAFKPPSVRYPFLNSYNEDWIWLYLHSRASKIARLGVVYHVPTRPPKGFLQEATFQEMGELIVTGVEVAVRDDVYESTLGDVRFWERISKVRIHEIEEMLAQSRDGHFAPAVKAAKAALQTETSLKPKVIASTFRRFFEGIGRWQETLNRARNSSFAMI